MSKYCENCGSKCFDIGCVNCDEDKFIDEQREENERMDLSEQRVKKVCDQYKECLGKDFCIC